MSRGADARNLHVASCWLRYVAGRSSRVLSLLLCCTNALRCEPAIEGGKLNYHTHCHQRQWVRQTMRYPVHYRLGYHPPLEHFTNTLANIIKTISGGCRRSEFVLLSVSTLCRRVRSSEQEGDRQTIDWRTRAVGWHVSQHLSLVWTSLHLSRT